MLLVIFIQIQREQKGVVNQTQFLASMQKAVYCYLLLFIAECVWSQTLKLHPLEKKNIKTDCDNGMIENINQYVLYADVDMTHSSDKWFRVITFEMKNSNSSEFVRFCLLNLENGCRTKLCYCEQKPTVNQSTFRIVINITAKMVNSEAEIRGVVTSVHNSIPMYSDTVKLPGIYDLSKRILKENDLTISPNQSPYKMKLTDRRLEFCCLNTPSPCVTTVVANHSATTSGDRCTVIDVPPDAGYDNLTVMTTVCHNQNFTWVILLETEDVASTPNQPNDTISFITAEIESCIPVDPFHLKLMLLVIPAALSLLIPALCLIIYFRVLNKKDKTSKVLSLKRLPTPGLGKIIGFFSICGKKHSTEHKNKEEVKCGETADAKDPLMNSIHSKTQPCVDKSDPVNTCTTLLNGTANTTTTMPEGMCAV